MVPVTDFSATEVPNQDVELIVEYMKGKGLTHNAIETYIEILNCHYWDSGCI